MKQQVQKFGRFLSGMVLPNISALIAWGFFTAIFLQGGWFPNEKMAAVISPMLNYLIPVLMGYTGGKMVYGTRGVVVGAVATFGIIIGGSIPMFLGAMIAGPLGGWLVKKLDGLLKDKIPTGFEMLYDNFSAGILGMILVMLCFWIMGPLVEGASNALGNGVKAIVDAGMLPLASVIIEPAKILFLNNAIQYGVLTPLGLADAAEVGKSIYFLLEGNLGPGLGVLLACWFFGKGEAKSSAPGAIIIQFFGGIHELYFPYVLMKPALIIAVILGGSAGILTNSLLGSGLVAAATPGSIFAYMAMAPKGGALPVLAGIAAATAVSFIAASIIYKRSKDDEEEGSFQSFDPLDLSLDGGVKKIVFACDAGMGSSAMAAATLTNKLNKAGINIKVAHTSVDEIPEDAEIILTHTSLADRAKSYNSTARIIAVSNFVEAPEYDRLVEELKKQQ